jgi:hypothetical protein
VFAAKCRKKFGRGTIRLRVQCDSKRFPPPLLVRSAGWLASGVTAVLPLQAAGALFPL